MCYPCKHCGHCELKKPRPRDVCPVCGERKPEGSSVCENCGFVFPPQPGDLTRDPSEGTRPDS